MIIGNSHVVSFFNRCIGAGNFSGTYLFVGPESVGKTHAALEVARAVQNHVQRRDSPSPEGLSLLGRGGKECLCASCSAILRDTHPDVLLFEKPLTIEDARAIKKQFAQSPLVAPFHIAIISNIHLATAEASQALLKLLEEPPVSAIFFLTADTVSSVPSPIVSRSTALHFFQVSQKELQALMPGEKRKAIGELAPYWRGRPGRIVRLLTDKMLAQQVMAEKKRAENFLHSSLGQRFSIAQKISSLERPDAIAAFENWMLWWEEDGAFQSLSELYRMHQSLTRTPVNIQTSMEYLAVAITNKRNS